MAGDVFTLFLSELIFWPIEAYAKSRTKRIGTAYYGSSNRILSWSVSRPGGEELFAIGVIPASSTAAANENPADEPTAVEPNGGIETAAGNDDLESASAGEGR